MKKLIPLILFLVVSDHAFSQNIPYCNTNGIAISGYDPVAYFLDQKATPGLATHTLTWSGSLWRFSTQAHLDSFKMAPERYAPQYGGYCAYGLSENHKSPTDPDAWTIIDNKLYLNYNMKIKGYWSKDIPGRIQAADLNWKELKNKDK